MSTAKDKAAAGGTGGRVSRWIAYWREVLRPETLESEPDEAQGSQRREGWLTWLLKSEPLEDLPVTPPRKRSTLSWLLAPEQLEDEPVARKQRRPWLAWVLAKEELEPTRSDGKRKK